MIRGKIETPREVYAREMVVGDPSFRQCLCGCKRYYDVKTHKEVEVTVTSFAEAFEDKCRVKEGE